MTAHRLLRWTVVAASMAVFAISCLIAPAANAQVKQLCYNKCQLNRSMCETRGTVICTPTRCDDPRLGTCGTDCTAADCGDLYNLCRQKCDQMPECTQDNQCGPGRVCERSGRRSQCVLQCKTNTECRQRLGPDGRCYHGHCARV